MIDETAPKLATASRAMSPSSSSPSVAPPPLPPSSSEQGTSSSGTLLSEYLACLLRDRVEIDKNDPLTTTMINVMADTARSHHPWTCGDMLAASRSRGNMLGGGEGEEAATPAAIAMMNRRTGRRKAGRNKEDKRRDTASGTTDGSADDIVAFRKRKDEDTNVGIMNSSGSVRRRRERLKQIQRLGYGKATSASRREAGGRGYDRWRSSHCNHVAPSWRITASTATQRNPHGIASATRMRQGDAAADQAKEATNNHRYDDGGCGVAIGIIPADDQQQQTAETGECFQFHRRPSQPSKPPISMDQKPSPPIRRSSLSSMSPMSSSSSTSIASQHSSLSSSSLELPSLPTLATLRTSGGRAAEVGRNSSISIDSNVDSVQAEPEDNHGRNNLGGTLPSSLLPSSKSTKRRNVAEAAPQNTMNAMAA